MIEHPESRLALTYRSPNNAKSLAHLLLHERWVHLVAHGEPSGFDL